MESKDAKPSRTLPRLLLVDDDPSILRVFAIELRRMGFNVETAPDLAPARVALAARAPEIIVLDIRLPGGNGKDLLIDCRRDFPEIPVIMLTGCADIELGIECMRLGAHDFLTKPCSLEHLELALRRALEQRDLRQRNQTLARGFSPMRQPGQLIGQSPAMVRLRERIARFAPTDEPVLIVGESGTGKELVAHALWRQSRRASGPYITENCCAVSETLLESELFGHEKGAFTGAEGRRAGLFELADGGTLLLDEIGDMTASMQAKLLRVLQMGEVRRVGGAAPVPVDVRFISATNKLLEDEVREGRFREDLLHRIDTLCIQVPPLRERIEDLPLLADHILEAFALASGGRALRVGPEVMTLLAAYDWPGNIRELQNVLKRAAILCDGELTPDDLPLHLHLSEAAPLAEPLAEPLADCSLAEIEKHHILRVLNHTGGNKTQAARLLGITKRTLYNKLALYGFRDVEVG